MKTITFRLMAVYYAVATVLALACAPLAGAQAGTSRSSTAIDPADVATEWFQLQLQLVQQTPGFSPPVASRAFGYSGVTLYESVVYGMPGYQSLAGQLNDLTELVHPSPVLEYHWATAANSALATMTRLLFPTASEENQDRIDALYTQFANRYREALDTDIFDRSEAHGKATAIAIFKWSQTDGGHEGYMRSFPSDYVAPVAAGLWTPTPRTEGDPQSALLPYWGENRTFMPESSDECMPEAPPAYSEDAGSAFYTEAMEVYQTGQSLTEEQTEIALFWSDDPGKTATPPGHTVSILTQILRHEEASLAFAAEAYAKLGIAVADSFIGCWKAKYEYNLVRPATYIQQSIEETWVPILNTPPFPEYPSGHSVQIGAAEVVLTGLFGDAYAFTDYTHDDMGLATRSFGSFSAMAEEAALSRLYGGIHFRSAIDFGLDQGRCIGGKVDTLVFRAET